jgi:hypothetical protein
MDDHATGAKLTNASKVLEKKKKKKKKRSVVYLYVKNAQGKGKVPSHQLDTVYQILKDAMLAP